MSFVDACQPCRATPPSRVCHSNLGASACSMPTNIIARCVQLNCAAAIMRDRGKKYIWRPAQHVFISSSNNQILKNIFSLKSFPSLFLSTVIIYYLSSAFFHRPINLSTCFSTPSSPPPSWPTSPLQLPTQLAPLRPRALLPHHQQPSQSPHQLQLPHQD